MGVDQLRRRILQGVAAIFGLENSASRSQGAIEPTSRSDSDELERLYGGYLSEHTHSGSQNGGSTLIPEELLHSARETNKHASDRRPIISTEPQDVYVDATNGDDTNPGTQQQPLATLREALERAPLFVQHRYHTHLADGVYQSDPNARGGPAHLVGSQPHNPHPMRIQGNPDNPSAVVIDGNPALSIRSNEMDNPVLTDLTITGSLQNQDSHFQVENIRFTGTSENAFNTAFISHNPSVTLFRNCTFSRRYETAVTLSLGAKALMDNCKGQVTGHALTVKQGSTAVDISQNSLSGQQGYATVESGSRYIRENGKAVRTGSV
jgi:hypothetical protein